jgi:hypothetical protein
MVNSEYEFWVVEGEKSPSTTVGCFIVYFRRTLLLKFVRCRYLLKFFLLVLGCRLLKNDLVHNAENSQRISTQLCHHLSLNSWTLNLKIFWLNENFLI